MNARDDVYALYQENLKTQFDFLNDRIGCMCMSPAGLKIGVSSKAKVEIANDTYVLVGGKYYTIDADDEVAFTAGEDITANASANQERVYLLTFDGTSAKLTGGTQAAEGSGLLPEIPDGEAVIGAVTVVLSSGSTDFDAGTTLLDAAAIDSVTYEDYGFLAPDFSGTK